jgi:hypothetical protein
MPPGRLLALLWAVLQLVLPLGATLADARAARASAAVVAHIESGSTEGCQPPHGEDCVVCRTLGAMHGVPTGIPYPAPQAESAARLDPRRISEISLAALPQPPSRAPPAA